MTDRVAKRGRRYLPWVVGGSLWLALAAASFWLYRAIRAGNHENLPEIVLVSGLAIATVAAFSMAVAMARRGQTGRLSSEIRDRRRAQRKLALLASRDPLTRLLNRIELTRRGEAMLATPKDGVLAVMFLDLDRFKDINDSMGHTMGDVLLKRVAKRLSEVLGKNDLLGRYGGDEFVIITRLPGVVQVEQLARRVLNAFERGFSAGRQQFHFSVSIGVALCSGADQSVSELIQNADIALFQAKKEGRNRFAMFTPGLLEKTSRRMQLARGIHRALQSNEFHMVYQPIVRLSDRRLRGLEALMRWRRPDGGEIEPVEFIPVAERTGTMEALTRFALETVSVDIAGWRRRYDNAPWVAVNVSAARFKERGFVARLKATLKRHALPPQLLQLEITELALVESLLRNRMVLEELTRLGVKLSVDDFGTGYSSLAYLKKFPVATIKISQSFVQDLDHDRSDQAIARAICDLAANLGMQTIAEGIETEQQLHLLIECGCDMGQGYWFSHPVPADEITALLARDEWVLPGTSHHPLASQT